MGTQPMSEQEYKDWITGLQERIQVMEEDPTVENLQLKIVDMEIAMNKLTEEKEKREEDGKKKKDLASDRSFNLVPTLGGPGAADWADFEFKFQSFVRPLAEFEKWLDWIKKQDETIKIDKMTEFFENEMPEDLRNSMKWCDDQLYTILNLKSSGPELQVVRNL